MKRIYILTVLLCFAVFEAQAQDNEKTPWGKRAVKTVKTFLDNLAFRNLDSTYLELPKHGWKVSVTTNFAGISASVEGHNIPTYQDISVDMRSKLSGQTAIMMGYRSLSASYSFDVAHGYSSDFNLAWFGKRFGVEFRSHSTEGLRGTLDATATEGNLPIKEGDTRLKATIINGYYVFNYKKYSLPAAMKQSVIQKRSAGSLTAYALFLSARLDGKNQMASAMLNGLKKIEFYQAAVGLGYGYNYTPNQGRLLMHISAAPLLVFFNKNFITAAVDVPLSDGSRFQTDISKEVKTKHKYFLTGVARASVHYNLSKQVYVGAAALVNDIRFSSASGVEMQMDDWIVNASVGVRF